MNNVSPAAKGAETGPQHATFEREVIERLGLLPNFFSSAPDAPELMAEVWPFVRSAYLDNPLPSAFKERLYVHLSRFCEVRYCLVRHVGFLTGRGRIAGDASVPPFTVEQVVQLLRWPGVPADAELDAALSRLEAYPRPAALPQPETAAEQDVFAAATLVFLEPARSERPRNALRRALAGRDFEFLMAFLAYVRLTHFWTLTHPDIRYDEDVESLLRHHQELARLLFEDAESGRCDMGRRLFDELLLLRKERDEREELRQALAERERAQKRQALLIDELNHRVKNTLAVVQSLATQTMRGPEVPEQVREAFTLRVIALARAHDALNSESWQGADLREVVARAVEMHGDGPARVRIVGPAVQLSSKMTISLSMAIHELTTNAMKYGALSNERGAVEVGWTVLSSDAGARLKLQWREVAGPRVVAPEKKGFGSRLIEHGLAAELGGEATIIYEPAGVICLIEAPLPATEPPG